jgi:hypothetical protein
VPTGVQGVAALTATLKQPLPPLGAVAERDAVAKRQAEAAIALLRLGHEDAVWPFLRQSSDNSRRTYLTRLLGQGNVESRVIIRRLMSEHDLSARRAWVLSLGSFAGAQILQSQRQEVVATLLHWYREEPDAGVHGAIDWLFRHSRQGEIARQLDWQQRQALIDIDHALAGRLPGPRSWYVTPEGQTMVIVRNPIEFRMGAPAYERPRKPASDSADEPVYRVRIPRSFAIASKEVTITEFRRFLDANPDVRRQHVFPGNPARMADMLARISPDDDGPQIAVTWYEAAMYCNWLSKQDGLPRSEWVYPEDFTAFHDGLELPRITCTGAATACPRRPSGRTRLAPERLPRGSTVRVTTCWKTTRGTASILHCEKKILLIQPTPNEPGLSES